MERDKLAIPPPWARWIGLAVEFQARPSVIPPLWRDDRCAPQSLDQADLEGYHSYKFIYSGFFTDFLNSRKLLILLVGAGRFERPTPCAQGKENSRLFVCFQRIDRCEATGRGQKRRVLTLIWAIIYLTYQPKCRIIDSWTASKHSRKRSY